MRAGEYGNGCAEPRGVAPRDPGEGSVANHRPRERSPGTAAAVRAIGYYNWLQKNMIEAAFGRDSLAELI